ncbi:MAG: hypothetical protein HYX60_01860 [Legionella longbeachae]|nr:hypothetical protein [Legionella longbeachae]
MPTKIKTQETIALFQKCLKIGDQSLIENISLKELEDTEIDLGWRDRDSSWRKAIQSRIVALKEQEQLELAEKKEIVRNKVEKQRHFQNSIIQIMSVIVGICIALLGWLYFK